MYFGIIVLEEKLVIYRIHTVRKTQYETLRYVTWLSAPAFRTLLVLKFHFYLVRLIYR